MSSRPHLRVQHWNRTDAPDVDIFGKRIEVDASCRIGVNHPPRISEIVAQSVSLRIAAIERQARFDRLLREYRR